MERKQFTFYASYYEALEDLTDKEQAEALLAIIRYALYEQEPEKLSKSAKVAFRLVRPTLDTGRRKAANGAKGGKSSNSNSACDSDESTEKANDKQNASKTEANDKQTVSEKEREKEGEKEKEREIEKENECYLSPLSPPPAARNEANRKQTQDPAARIRLLETKLRLFRSGAMVDPEEERFCHEELRRLKGGV